MSRQEIKTWATYRMFLTRPHPYMVSLVFVFLLQAISLISMQIGGQPFVMDMTAMAAGDTVNAIRFVPENVTLRSTLLLLALELVAVLNRQVTQDGKQQYFLNALRIYVRSVLDALGNGDPDGIRFPVYEL